MQLNVRQECFVQNLVAEGMNATAAYKAAGYLAKKDVTARNGAHELLTNPYVKRRLAEVQAEHAQRAALTVDDLIDKLERLYCIAVEDRQPGPGVKAVLAIARLLGLDRQELHAEIICKPAFEPDVPREMSLEEWSQRYKAIGYSP